jgi:hypothetical protein
MHSRLQRLLLRFDRPAARSMSRIYASRFVGECAESGHDWTVALGTNTVPTHPGVRIVEFIT